jgi:hypothetical protein
VPFILALGEPMIIAAQILLGRGPAANNKALLNTPPTNNKMRTPSTGLAIGQALKTPKPQTDPSRAK